MQFKQLLLEIRINKIREELEKYLDKIGSDEYDFPYISDATVRIRKGTMGAFGGVLIVSAMRDGQLAAKAIIMQGGETYYRNSRDKKARESERYSGPEKLFGNLLEIMG